MAPFRRAVDKGMELAARAERYVQEIAVLEFLTPVSLGIVCLRINPEDRDHDEKALEQINRKVLARALWEDRAFLSSTLFYGTFTLRLCIINHNTSWDDVRETLEAVERFGVEASAWCGSSFRLHQPGPAVTAVADFRPATIRPARSRTGPGSQPHRSAGSSGRWASVWSWCRRGSRCPDRSWRAACSATSGCFRR